MSDEADNPNMSIKLESMEEFKFSGNLFEDAARHGQTKASIKTNLADHKVWVRKSPAQILLGVKEVGGWTQIFPDGPPRWAHKLRNYFNVEPRTLIMNGKADTQAFMTSIRSHGHLSSFTGKRTLSGHVYQDGDGGVWYQMTPGGTIYHWGRDVWWETPEGIKQHIVGQDDTPVFKLVSPDGTGGSRETIVKNEGRLVKKTYLYYDIGPREEDVRVRDKQIGTPHKAELVISRIETSMRYQGSYNYAETTVVGLKQHQKYDVTPHVKDKKYIDPPDRFAPLEKRIFFEEVMNAAVNGR